MICAKVSFGELLSPFPNRTCEEAFGCGRVLGAEKNVERVDGLKRDSEQKGMLMA